MRSSLAGLIALACVCGPVSAQDAPEPDSCDAWAQKPQAWEQVEQTLRDNYAYLDRVENLDLTFAAAQATAGQIDTIEKFGTIVETLGYAFRDGHFHVDPVVAPARAWIPSASDFWVLRKNDRWVVADVKQGSAAYKKGVRPGWELLARDGQAIDTLARYALYAVTAVPSPEQLEFAVNTALTGRLGRARAFLFRDGEEERRLELPPALQSFDPRPDEPVSATRHGSAVRLRFNNSLGNNDLVPEFDRLMQEYADAPALILDFRDTPGGGNTTVARAIIGHFVAEPKVYQVHRNMYQEQVFGVPRQYAEYVFPRGKRFEGKVVVLGGYWTGSVGEALVQALDKTAGIPTIGTGLGDLLGTLNRSNLGPDEGTTCLTISYAWDKLFASDGTPREDYVPATLFPSGDTAPDGSDPALEAALQQLRE
ncbi:MAG: S41 family peptidase [Pseudomonadota bacterium]